MFYKLLFLFITITSNCGVIPGTTKEDKSTQNLILGAGILQSLNRTTSVSTSVSTINFSAISGNQEVACGTNMSGMIGNSASSKLVDLRFYVHDVKLFTSSGTKVDFDLSTDNQWQLAKGSNNFGAYPSLALLDFENATADCAGGTTEMNKSIRGNTLSGTFTGIEFKVGVPFFLNHLQATTATAPLNVTAMYWAWNSGYKFAKVEYSSNDTNSSANRFHLGSGTCSGNSAGPVNACGQPNLPTISITKTSGNFNPSTDKIVLDLGTMFNGADGKTLTTGSDTAIRTCMAGNTNANCQPIISNIGVNVSDGQSKTAQTSFSIR